MKKVLRKILSGVLSSIHEDAVFHSLVKDCSTVALSLSASPTSFWTVLRTSSLLEISLFIPGANILLLSGQLAPITLAECTFPLLFQKRFNQICDHERLHLKWVERKTVAFERHLVRVCHDMSDDVNANYVFPFLE